MDKETVKPNGLSSKHTMAVVALSSILGATGAPVLLVSLGGPSLLRPDPFTGAQGAVHERRIEQLEWHLKNHPDQSGKFETRIATLEAQNTIIISELRRMSDRLDDFMK